jgi:hypothetical protein
MYRWLLYNIFRFESFIRVLCHYPEYVLFERPLVTSLSDTRDRNETFRTRVAELLKTRRGTLAPRLVSLTAIFLLVTPWNLVCGALQIKNLTVWFAGWIFASIAAFIATVLADNPRKFLNDFKKDDLQTQKGFRRSALIVSLITIGIWLVFVLSLYYLIGRALPIT